LSDVICRTSLFKACLLVLIAALPLHAADLTGKVTNAEGGEPLGKVQVTVVGTTQTTTTAKDGTFHLLNAPSGKQALQVKAVGYRSISIAFDTQSSGENKDFAITLLPDNFQRTDKVEVHADLFQSPEWPAVGDMTLTSSELQQTATVIANDPFRSIQALPGVSASGNNDLFAQFSVMGAPFENVGIYVDDVFVPNLLHSVPGTPDAPTLSLLTGNDVADLRLLPVAYPVRYADAAGAAVVIRTRQGDLSQPLIHASVGLATTEFLGQGVFGPNHKATWLVGARKSYISYLERYLHGTRLTDDGFYDTNFKLTYDVTPNQKLSVYATGGQLGVNDPHPVTNDPAVSPYSLESGTSNLAIARLGWQWAASPKLLVNARAAFVRTGSEQDNAFNQLIRRDLDREWSIGSRASWSWRPGAILQTGYSLRRPHFNFASNFFLTPPPPAPQASFSSERFSDVRQDFYIQQSLPLWHDRLRLQGGVRWARLNTEREQPVTGQISASVRVASDTTLEGSWGRYAQLPERGGIGGGIPIDKTTFIFFGSLPYRSSQYAVAAEQRVGDRVRLRVEAFARENESSIELFQGTVTPQGVHLTPLVGAAPTGRDYPRGVQFLLQRRSENRLSGWIGYTFTRARSRSYSVPLPPPIRPFGIDLPSAPTPQDQPHTVNVFASYRLTPSIRLSAKGLYGSGFPAPLGLSGLTATQRIGPYERLDLRGEKSWTFNRWKLSLYTELLNVTAHDNHRFGGFTINPVTNTQVLLTDPGFPFIPTAGLGFDF
jgi:hypothetical protein